MRSARRTKRPNGDGTVYRRGNGYEAAITVNGRRRTSRAPDRPAAEAALRRLRALRDTAQLPPDDRMTVAAFLEYWLSAVEPSLRHSTYARYEQYIRIHVVPFIGNQRLSRLRAVHLQDLYAKRQAAGLSAQSVLHLHRVVHKALHDAEGWEMVTRNVAHHVKPPKVPAHEFNTLTTAQVAQLIAHAEADPLGALFVLAVTTGMRQGELLGLRWGDLDLDQNSVARVQGAMQRAPQGRVRGEPKTPRSRRTVEIIEPARVSLVAYRRRQREARLALAGDWQEPDLVFTDGWEALESRSRP